MSSSFRSEFGQRTPAEQLCHLLPDVSHLVPCSALFAEDAHSNTLNFGGLKIGVKRPNVLPSCRLPYSERILFANEVFVRNASTML